MKNKGHCLSKLTEKEQLLSIFIGLDFSVFSKHWVLWSAAALPAFSYSLAGSTMHHCTHSKLYLTTHWTNTGLIWQIANQATDQLAGDTVVPLMCMRYVALETDNLFTPLFLYVFKIYAMPCNTSAPKQISDSTDC